MGNSAFAYAVLAGVSMATYIVAARLGASGTHPALGTAIVTGVAFLINVVLTLSIRATGAPVNFSMTSAYSLTHVSDPRQTRALSATKWPDLMAVSR